MSDKNQDTAMLTEEEKLSFGEKLKTTRENMGLSVQDAASRLHLSPRFITMLENENLQLSTLPRIYLRGYLRSYGRLLNINETLLAQVLETLDPSPMALEPLPVAASTESLSLTFPLENNSYYARIATFFIALTLLTSITVWWYLHANTPADDLIALNQPLNPESQQALPAATNEAPTVALNTTTQERPLTISPAAPLEATASSPMAEQAQVPEASLNLATKKTLTLASAATEQNINSPAAKPAPSREEVDDDNVDEQE